MDPLFIYSAILDKLHDAREWACRYWLALVTVAAAVAISVALAAGPHVATLLVCGFIVQVAVNAGVLWMLGRRLQAVRRELDFERDSRLWWENYARSRDEHLSDKAEEIARLKVDLLAATEEKTALRRWQEQAITGTPEVTP